MLTFSGANNLFYRVLAGFIVYCAVLSNTSGWRTGGDIGLDRVMVLTAQVGADGAGGWHFLFLLNGIIFLVGLDSFSQHEKLLRCLVTESLKY